MCSQLCNYYFYHICICSYFQVCSSFVWVPWIVYLHSVIVFLLHHFNHESSDYKAVGINFFYLLNGRNLSPIIAFTSVLRTLLSWDGTDQNHFQVCYTLRWEDLLHEQVYKVHTSLRTWPPYLHKNCLVLWQLHLYKKLSLSGSCLEIDSNNVIIPDPVPYELIVNHLDMLMAIFNFRLTCWSWTCNPGGARKWSLTVCVCLWMCKQVPKHP